MIFSKSTVAGVAVLLFCMISQTRLLSQATREPAPETGYLSPTHIAQLNPGVVSGNTYTNRTLGFALQFPAGWIVADKATQDKVMEAGHQFAYVNDPAAAREHEVAKQCGRMLLWTTQYPEGAKTGEVDPLVAILAFDSDCLPGVHLPSSMTDGDAIRQVGVQMSRALSGTPFIRSGQKALRAYMLQNRLMLDLSGEFKADAPDGKQPVDIYTSVVFTQDNNYWVAWIFMQGSQSGLDDLRNNVKIAFATSTGAAEQKTGN